MNYVCLNSQKYSESSYTLVPLRHQDIFDIMQWRNEQIQFLRQKHLLTKDEQEKYFQTVILPSFGEKQPRQILFSLLLNNACIGYGGLVHIDWLSRRGEISFLVNTKRAKDTKQYNQDFTAFLALIKKVAFDDLHFHRLFTETFDIRQHHISILEDQGFAFEGRLKEHTVIDGKFVDSLMHGMVRYE